MYIWCMLIVVIQYGGQSFQTETAVKGLVVSQTSEIYTVDFSEYANEKRYLGDWSAPKEVVKDNCVKDKP